MPKKLRVLLATPNEHMMAQATTYLGTARCETKPVRTADSALVLATEWQPDLIILDEDIEGYHDVVVELRGREDLAFSKIALMVSQQPDETLTEKITQNISEFIRKPFEQLDFNLRIANLLDLREREVELDRYKGILQSFFSQDFIDQVLSGKIKREVGGQKLMASIMFFDLRNSMVISQELDPETLSGFLSELFTDVMDIVYANNGSVNRMLGDGMLITFGVPESSEDHCMNSVKCAHDIQEHFRTYNEVRPDYLKEPIAAGMGIATGNLFAGNIGSVHRLEYTVLGDTVNIAARLESYNKLVKSDVLIDGYTYDRVKESVKAKAVKVKEAKGRMKSVRIYQLLGLS